MTAKSTAKKTTTPRKKTTKKVAKTTNKVDKKTESKEIKNVICSLTGKELPENQAFTLNNFKDEQVVISLSAVFQMAAKPAILQPLALTDETFNAIVQFRQQAEAKTKGVQEGASQAVQALKQKAQEMGLTEDLEKLVEAAFKSKEEEAKE